MATNGTKNKVLLDSITRACKLKNDVISTRLPISEKLLELILMEINRIYKKQIFLETMYKALLAIGFYGLFRIGELTQSPHVMKACNVHLANNKRKMLIVLYSSKTHGKDMRPQKIRITGKDMNNDLHYRHFCPFALLQNYLNLRGPYNDENEQLFIFSDGTPVLPDHVRKILRKCLENLNLNEKLYNCQSLRIGRATQLEKLGFSISEIRQIGRWRSSAVYKYLRN